jgi:hypothetical protein
MICKTKAPCLDRVEQGAFVLQEYLRVRRNDEGCSATQHPDFLRSRQVFLEVALPVW